MPPSPSTPFGGHGDELPDLDDWAKIDGRPLPIITSENISKILDGRVEVDRTGKARLLGGHAFDKRFTRKSEFPEVPGWSDVKILRERIEATMQHAHFRVFEGNRVIARREFDEVIFEVGWYYDKLDPIFLNAMPTNGRACGSPPGRDTSPSPARSQRNPAVSLVFVITEDLDVLLSDLLAAAGDSVSEDRAFLIQSDLDEGLIMFAIDDVLRSMGEAGVSIPADLAHRVEGLLQSDSPTSEDRMLSQHLAVLQVAEMHHAA